MSGAQVARVPLSATEIYEQVHAGPGTSRLSGAQQAAVELRDQLEDCSDEVRALTTRMREGWQGEASSAAAGAATPLADASRHDAELLAVADRAIGDQISAFDNVRNTVVPVPPDPPEMTSQDMFDTFSSGLAVHTRNLIDYQTTNSARVSWSGASNLPRTRTRNSLSVMIGKRTDRLPPTYTAFPDGPRQNAKPPAPAQSRAKAGAMPSSRVTSTPRVIAAVVKAPGTLTVGPSGAGSEKYISTTTRR